MQGAHSRTTVQHLGLDSPPPERDDLSSNRHPALRYWWSMIFSENRYPLFGIMLNWWSMAPAFAGTGLFRNRYPPPVKPGAGFFGIMLQGQPVPCGVDPPQGRPVGSGAPRSPRGRRFPAGHVHLRTRVRTEPRRLIEAAAPRFGIPRSTLTPVTELAERTLRSSPRLSVKTTRQDGAG